MRAWAISLFVCFWLASPVAAEKRVALVIGNASYRHITSLDNATSYAQLMTAALRGLDFTLVGDNALLDLDKAEFDGVVQRFGREVQGANVALFYYAGHGVQVRGENYLVPVGANPVREADIDFEMLNTSLVLRQMEAAGTRLNIVILDACRNNPFGGRGLRALSSGLAQMHAPEGTLISFATQPGNVALDGASGNSPYTEALVKTVKRPGLDLFQTFNEVGLAVKRATGGAQQPWVSSSPISGSFYFAGAAATTSIKGASTTNETLPSDSEAGGAWGVTKDTTSVAVLENFVQQFGTTPYGSMAKARLEELKRAQRFAVPRPESVSPRLQVPEFPPSHTPSFDCATNRSVSEIAICGSSRLSLLDQRLDGLYTALRGRLSGDQQSRLIGEQRTWLRRRSACSRDETCLTKAYEARIAELQSWQPESVSPRLQVPEFPPSHTPSFVCATNRSVSEIAICGSSRLSLLDQRLDGLYTALRGRLSGDQQSRLIGEQRTWLRRRSACSAQICCQFATAVAYRHEVSHRW